jgi:hypothetical protein
VRKGSRAAGWFWLLLILIALCAAVIVVAGTLRARGDMAIGQWGLWAAAATLVVTAIGVSLPLWDRFVTAGAVPKERVREAVAELATVVLQQTELQRSQLIGIDEASDHPADLRFVKAIGRFRSVGGLDEGHLASVVEYYLSLSPRRLVVLGVPGAGKTVLALELLTQLLERRQVDESIPVPVLMSAAAYDTGVVWEDWLIGHLAQRFSLARHIAKRLVRDKSILPVIDGLDEMDLPGCTRRAARLVAELNTLMRFSERAPIVVTCRRAEYQNLDRHIDRATHIEMVQMTAGEAAEYLSKEFLGEEERELWAPVLAELCNNPDGLLASHLATPWRLTLALAAFRDGGDPLETLSALLPSRSDTTAIDYARELDELLLTRYIAVKVHLYGRATNYTPQRVQRWLAAMAGGLAWQAHHDGSATDIQLDLWWRPVGEKLTRLVHMAAVLIIAVPWLVAAVTTHQLGLAIIGATVLPFVVLASFSPSPHQLRFSQLRTPRGLLEVLSRTAVGLIAGLALGLAGRFASPVIAVLTFALGLALMATLVLDVKDSSPQAIGPRDVIQADRRFGLLAGLAFGVGGALAGGLAGALARWLAARLGVGLATEHGGLVLGLTEGLTLGLAFGLAFGAASSVRYRIGVLIGAFRGSLPTKFGAFLDWAQRSGLLRTSGIAYQFRHRQLQDWLVSGGERSPQAGHVANGEWS